METRTETAEEIEQRLAEIGPRATRQATERMQAENKLTRIEGKYPTGPDCYASLPTPRRDRQTAGEQPWYMTKRRQEAYQDCGPNKPKQAIDLADLARQVTDGGNN